MERIKSVLSHGSRKSTDATRGDNSAPSHSTNPESSTAAPTGQGSHFAAASGDKSEEHPIYDQMTGQMPHATSSSEPVNTNEAPPHFSNTASLKHPPTTTPSAIKKPTLSATPASGGSTASIKSGVIGFPQGEHTHAALSKTQRGDRTLREETTKPDQTRDAALGTGTVHQLHHQRDHENLRESSTGQPFEQSFREPQLATDTDRSFPLAGGVTTRKQADHPQAPHVEHGQTTAISEREPGTKEMNAPTSSNHGREGLAGAAGVATLATIGAYGATRKSDQPENKLDHQQADHSALSGLSGSSGLRDNQVSSSDRELLQAEHELRSGHQHSITNAGGDSLNQPTVAQIPTEHEGNPHRHNDMALAAATTAAATSSSVPRYDTNKDHEHGGHGHTFSGDPCKANNGPPTNVFTSGPHATDTANLFDPRQEPHLHIPGEYPETPAETPLDHKTGTTSGYIGGHSTSQADIAPNPTAASEEKHHHGRDAAIAGGLGAAGVGAYTATKHHREPADISTAPIASESSPYSSTKLDPRVNPQSAKLEQQQSNPTGQTLPSAYGPGQTTSSQAGTVAPNLTEEKQEHHYGRNAGTVGAGAGLIGAGAAAAHLAHRQSQHEPQSKVTSPTPEENLFNRTSQQPSQTSAIHYEPRSTIEDPASKTVGPHSSNAFNVLDPRVKPQPEKQKGHSTLGPHGSDTFNRLDPKVDSSNQQPKGDHQIGRDAAITGGTGAAGLSAYEVATKYDEHRSTGPAASMNDQRYDPTLPGAHDPNQADKHHYGRDAAVVGGLGAAGIGAYAASQHRDGKSQQIGSSPNHHPTSTTGYPQEHQTQQTQQIPQASQVQHSQQTPQYQHSQQTPQYQQVPQAQQAHEAQRDPAHQRYDSVQNPEENHGKRNAAALGAAGIAGVGGAYAYSQHDAEKAEKERLAQEKAAEKEHHAQEKAQKKAEEKELEHARKEQQKQVEHERKQQQKELDHKLKEQEKAFQHEQHKIEQQQVRDQKHEDKLAAAEGKKLERERSRRSEDIGREGQEGKEKKHHLFGFLHRDKDKQSRSNESSPRQSREYVGAGSAGLGASEISHESDSSEGKKHRNRLHKDPPRGHPAYEALEHQHSGQSGNGPTDQTNRLSGDRNTRPGAYDSYPSNEQPTKVTEPHTGLPMNVGQYGDGRGGTDGNANIHGHHEVPGASQQGGVTDWEAIRKANTPY